MGVIAHVAQWHLNCDIIINAYAGCQVWSYIECYILFVLLILG